MAKGNACAGGRVWVCGALPSILYDSVVHGMPARQLKKVRSLTAQFLRTGGKGRSLDIALSFFPDRDPERIVSSGLMLRYASEVWDASLPPDIRGSSTISLGTLARGVAEYLQSHPAPPTTYSGPLSALHGHMRSGRWNFVFSFVLKTREGHEVNLSNTCPKRILGMFRRDVSRTILARGVRKAVVRSDCPMGRTLVDNEWFFQPILNLHKKMPKKEAALLRAWCADGIVTNVNLINMGFDAPPDCPKCGLAPDTLFHRCYTCVHVSAKAIRGLGEELFDKILVQGEDGLMANRGMHPLPALASAASPDSMMGYHNFGPHDFFLPEDGDLFGDGSCLDLIMLTWRELAFPWSKLMPKERLSKLCGGSSPAGSLKIP